MTFEDGQNRFMAEPTIEIPDMYPLSSPLQPQSVSLFLPTAICVVFVLTDPRLVARRICIPPSELSVALDF